jgi:hypothetical protein
MVEVVIKARNTFTSSTASAAGGSLRVNPLSFLARLRQRFSVFAESWRT